MSTGGMEFLMGLVQTILLLMVVGLLANISGRGR